MFGHNLDDDIQSDLSGDLCRVMRSLVSGNRDANHTVDLNLAKKEAQELYDAGEGKFGTDEIEFIRILCSRSFAQLKATFENYFQIADNSIEKGIKKEMSGNLSIFIFFLYFLINNFIRITKKYRISIFSNHKIDYQFASLFC